jgi:hypothetical protein
LARRKQLQHYRVFTAAFINPSFKALHISHFFPPCPIFGPRSDNFFRNQQKNFPSARKCRKVETMVLEIMSTASSYHNGFVVVNNVLNFDTQV